MGLLHMFAEARMPIWGVLAIFSNILLAVFSSAGQRGFYAVSILKLLSFLIVYGRLSKPINRLQIESGQNRRSLDNGRELQALWNPSLVIRVPLLIVILRMESVSLTVLDSSACPPVLAG